MILKVKNKFINIIIEQIQTHTYMIQYYTQNQICNEL